MVYSHLNTSPPRLPVLSCPGPAQTSCGGRVLACCSGCASVICDAVGWVRTLIGCALLLVSLVLVGSLVCARARENTIVVWLL
jgi:hypothetical protein